MRRPAQTKRSAATHADLAVARSIDKKYGLDPVIEPGLGVGSENAPDSLQSQLIECPYCGESFETSLDTSSGSARYIEDCQVCCRPIEFSLEVDQAGEFIALAVQRSELAARHDGCGCSALW